MSTPGYIVDHFKVKSISPRLIMLKSKRSVLLLWFVLLYFFAFSQSPSPIDSSDILKKNSRKSSLQHFVDYMQNFGRKEAENSIDKYNQNIAETKQDALVEEIVRLTHEARNHIRIGLDTVKINAEMDKLERWDIIAGDGVFTNQGTVQTQRNLVTTEKLLREFLNRALFRKTEIDAYYKELVSYRNRIDSLSSDSVLYDFSSDSVRLMKYVSKLMTIGKEMAHEDSIVEQGLVNVQDVQSKVNLMVNELNGSLEKLAFMEKEVADKTFFHELPYLWGPVPYSRPMREIIAVAWEKGMLVLMFYTRNNIGKILFMFLLVAAATIFLRSLKEKLIKENKLQDDFTGQLILRYPFLSALMIVFNLIQFIFQSPPFIFDLILWIISGISLTVIFRGYITKYWMNAWLTMFVIFLLASADNLVLQASRTERVCMFLLAIAGVTASSIILIKGRRNELREKWIVYFIGFAAILDFFSIIANLFGRYNLSKTLLTSSFFNVIIAIMFLWTVRLINEALRLSSDIYQRPERKLFYINFEKVGRKVPPVFYVLLVIGWFILFGRNFYAYRMINDPIEDFLFAERTIGNYTFSIKSVLIFFLILILSAAVSKVVSFFASDKHDMSTHSSDAKRAGLGSWLLLIRISIISIGLFLAFAAAGIPIDKITIVLGALSVGIGFGMQTLVNNLVSGLIISFEKPVSVGDVVEISGQSGTMKSIGFRSSILTTFDGADVIIPNGDLLNEHLINWTMGKHTRRADIILGVAYGTDLDKAKKLLLDILIRDERILKFPAPAVLLNDFNNSSIDLQLYFWVRNIREWRAVKSDAILSIDLAFKENNIVIPFPQQDLHIRSIEPTIKKQEENESNNNASY